MTAVLDEHDGYEFCRVCGAPVVVRFAEDDSGQFVAEHALPGDYDHEVRLPR